MITCMGVDIRSLLRQPKNKLARIFKHPTDARWLTADEAREVLFDCLSEGKEVLPLGKCDNWDYKTGCRGHAHQQEKSNA